MLVDNNAPTVALEDPGAFLRGTVVLTATASDGSGAGIATVRLQRSLAETDSWTDICTDASTPYTCSLATTTLTNGEAYDLRAIAANAAGNTATSDIDSVDIDNVAPAITMTNPGATLSGTITLATSPTDADSGIAGVTVQRSPAGLNSWTTACAAGAAPWSCRFDTTTVSDGLYDFRATAVDAAGNTTTSATVTARRIDNTTISTVSLDDPGAFMRATVTLSANANALGGVASVRIQRSKAGAGTWTDICTDTTSPYSCAFDTTTAATPDGAYDLRAIMLSNLEVTTTSASVTNRTIDNTVVRGLDVQTVNAVGGTLGRFDAGDQLVLTYSTRMKASTLISGWSGRTRRPSTCASPTPATWSRSRSPPTPRVAAPPALARSLRTATTCEEPHRDVRVDGGPRHLGERGLGRHDHARGRERRRAHVRQRGGAAVDPERRGHRPCGPGRIDIGRHQSGTLDRDF